jgi:serine/threonine protein kinase
MGVVYLVHNRLIGREEVIKVVGRALVERPRVRARFLREVESAARLQPHPNIVVTYAVLKLGDGLAFSMEYVQGEDLHRLVATCGPLPVGQACDFAYQTAVALQHADGHGVIHRDIKPGNLIACRQGGRPVIKVLDFGLAKATREVPHDGGLTHEGQLIGTPDYIAPEQAVDAQKVDIRADIYSLGCTLYHLLSARPPFQGTSLYEILQAHVSTDATPINLLQPHVPPAAGRGRREDDGEGPPGALSNSAGGR